MTTLHTEAEEAVRQARGNADNLAFLYEERSLNAHEIRKIDAARESIAVLAGLISRLAAALSTIERETRIADAAIIAEAAVRAGDSAIEAWTRPVIDLIRLRAPPPSAEQTK